MHFDPITNQLDSLTSSNYFLYDYKPTLCFLKVFVSALSSPKIKVNLKINDPLLMKTIKKKGDFIRHTTKVSPYRLSLRLKLREGLLTSRSDFSSFYRGLCIKNSKILKKHNNKQNTSQVSELVKITVYLIFTIPPLEYLKDPFSHTYVSKVKTLYIKKTKTFPYSTNLNETGTTEIRV